jgi:hypothetical protein
MPHVRICAGGGGKPSSLPRRAPNDRLVCLPSFCVLRDYGGRRAPRRGRIPQKPLSIQVVVETCFNWQLQ